MNRKIRTHTAHGRTSKSRNEKSERDLLPERPQTSLGFDRELSHINEALQRGKVKKKILSDKPSERNAFKSVNRSKQRVLPLNDVLARFMKYEEAWERRRYPLNNPNRPQSCKADINGERFCSSEQSLQQTRLKKSPASRTSNEISKDYVRNKSASKKEKSTKNEKSLLQLLEGKRDFKSNSSPGERPQNLEEKHNRRQENNKQLDIILNKNEEQTQSDQSGSPFQSKSQKKLKRLDNLSTVVEAEDIERYIEDKESSAIGPVSTSVSPISNEVFKHEDNEKDYDTDLEDDFPAPAVEEYDPSGRKVYIESCKSQEVVPVTYIYKRLGAKELVMRHHGLGPNGTKPLANALMGHEDTARNTEAFHPESAADHYRTIPPTKPPRKNIFGKFVESDL